MGKTDIKDAEWIADLLRHGLLKASFIPPQPIRILRELTRYRTSLIQERAQEVNRLQKTLEGANIKLAAVATDVLGKSGRDMIQAVIDGTTDACVLASLARGLLRKKLPQLQEALFGRVQPHHRVLLRHILAHVDFLDAQLSQLLQEIETQLAPFQEEQALLESIPGIQATTAAVIMAEIGWTCAFSRQTNTWHHGLACVRAIARAVASDSVGPRPLAIPIFAQF